MNCREIEIYLYDYAEGNMLTENKFLIKEHLEGCINCRQKVAYYNSIHDVMEAEKNETPSFELTDRILRQVAENNEPTISLYGRKQVFMRFAAAVVIGIGIISGVLIGNSAYSTTTNEQLSINEQFGFDTDINQNLESWFVGETINE